MLPLFIAVFWLFVVVSHLCAPLGASYWQLRARNCRWHQIKSEMEWPIQTHMTMSNASRFISLSYGQCSTVRARQVTVYNWVLLAYCISIAEPVSIYICIWMYPECLSSLLYILNHIFAHIFELDSYVFTLIYFPKKSFHKVWTTHLCLMSISAVHVFFTGAKRPIPA